MEIPPISSTYTSSEPSAQPVTIKRSSEAPTRGDMIHQQGDNGICCILECVCSLICRALACILNLFGIGREDPDDNLSPEELLERLPPDRQAVVLMSEGPLDEVLFKDQRLLLREAEAFYANVPIPEPLGFSDIPDGIAVEDLLTNLLGKYDKLFIGETHTHSSPKYFLVKYLPTMVRLGVDTIDIEGWPREEWQKHFDIYFNEDRITPVLEFAFARERRKSGDKYSEAEVIIAAKQAGIKRIVCADTLTSQSLPASKDAVAESRRIGGGNYQSKCIIQRTPGKGKRIGWFGAGHTCSVGGVPGLGQLFKAPSLYIHDLEEKPVVGDLGKKDEFLVQPSTYIKERNKREYLCDFVVVMAPPHKPKE